MELQYSTREIEYRKCTTQYLSGKQCKGKGKPYCDNESSKKIKETNHLECAKMKAWTS